MTVSAIGRATAFAGKLFPFLGWLVNRVRWPGLHCGVAVELPVPGSLHHGRHVTIGGYSRLYAWNGGQIALEDGSGLGRDVHLETHGGRISIGKRTGLNDGGSLFGSVAIGANCAIGPRFFASSGFHQFRSDEPWRLIHDQERRQPAEDAPVVIGDDCWIGVNVVVLRGVTVGRGAVLGANSLVTKDVPPYAIMAGIPARQIGERLNFDPPASLQSSCPQHIPYFYAGFDQAVSDDVAAAGFHCDGRAVIALRWTGDADAALSIEIEVQSNAPRRISCGEVDTVGGPGQWTALLDLQVGGLPFVEILTDGPVSIRAARLLARRPE